MKISRKQLGTLLAVLIAAGVAWLQGGDVTEVLRDATNATTAGEVTDGASAIDEAFRTQRSDVMVRDSGRVVRVLADDNEGSRHQRFIVEIESGLTVLIAHNIDLAPRVAGVKPGDIVRFNGEYEWNDRGGVIHWTHHDPRGRRSGGWIEHGGRIFE